MCVVHRRPSICAGLVDVFHVHSPLHLSCRVAASVFEADRGLSRLWDMSDAHVCTVCAKLSVERGPMTIIDGLAAIEPLVSPCLSLTMSQKFSMPMQSAHAGMKTLRKWEVHKVIVNKEVGRL